MKQILQNFKTGELSVADVPTPILRPEGILMRTRASLISAGTERSVIDFAEKSMLEKAKARPDLVKQVLNKAKREGVLATFEAVQNRLEQLLPLGYSSAGEVIAVGAGAPEYKVGDRVACAGMGYASHAEIAYVPRTLAVKIPAGVSFEEASFSTLGAIALQGVRQAEVSVGDNVGVVGLGLLGKLTAQILKASGCQVYGIDTSQARVDEAAQFGCDSASLVESATEAVSTFTSGRGLDRVIITAQTSDNGPVELAGEIARDRAIIVAVGDVGMTIPRRSYYMKELDFRLSRSYGPGRYDASYEDRGHDYPYGYVRWTEQRNMEAFLRLVADGKIAVKQQISHRFAIEEAKSAYQLISGHSGASFSSIVLTYSGVDPLAKKIELHSSRLTPKSDAMHLGVIGAGSFAAGTLLPAIKAAGGIEFTGIASANGISARTMAQRFGFGFCATSAEEVLSDTRVNTVAVLTRHDLHAKQVVAALAAKKNVFVEKPLALNEAELHDIEAAYSAAGQLAFLVGFNRRFAPYSRELRERLAGISETKLVHIRVNAGFIPANHWIHDPVHGGGRLLGEGCHFYDLLCYFIDSEPVSVQSTALSDNGKYRNDNFTSTVKFADGSVGTLIYVANGDRQLGKEMIEVFAGGLSARLNDFNELAIFHNGRSTRRRSRMRSDKGHKAEWQAFTAEIRGEAGPAMTFGQACASMRLTFAAQESLLTGVEVRCDQGAKTLAASSSN